MMKKTKYFQLSVICIILLLSSSFGVALHIQQENEIKPTFSNITLDNDYEVDITDEEFYRYYLAEPGVLTSFWIEITNTGILGDTYDITASSIEDIICLVNNTNADEYTPFELTLASGVTDKILVTAKINDEITAPPLGEWAVIVTARSQNDSNVEDTLTITINIVEDIPYHVTASRSSYKRSQPFMTYISASSAHYPGGCMFPDNGIYNEQGEYLFGFYLLGGMEVNPEVYLPFIPLVFMDKGKYSFSVNFDNGENEYIDTITFTITAAKTKALQHLSLRLFLDNIFSRLLQ